IDRDMGAKHANWFVTSAKTTGWLRETELVPKTQGVVSSIKEMKFAMSLALKGKVPPPFPPHVAEGVEESRRLYDIVKTQGRDGAMGIVQGERALSRLEHHETGESQPASEFPQPWLAEKGQTPVGGANEGMGSRTQADVTPGEKPTEMYGDNQPGQGDAPR
ncbi:MAG: succinate dehydrogenase / fumarate reductase, iron-sulfur subunit, partial [Gaiellaceae bacterium]|nr:succinate dehydrogenase / fumarate reductase, iron-sulfur subunit [Gaiellaceae bacterium]